MDSDNIIIIFAVYFIVFFALMYGVVSGFISDIHHEIDSGIHTEHEIRGLVFMQGAAIWVYAFAFIMTFFVFLYMFTH